MPQILQVEEFSATLALLPEVQNFDCGSDQQWQRDVSVWIKRPINKLGALRSMARRGTRAWLYWHPDGRLVGYGAIGTTEWQWPPPAGPKTPVTAILFVGIQTVFHGEPSADDRENRFSHQIMRDLLSKCVSFGNRDLVLKVHKDNTAAQRLYDRFQFSAHPVTNDDFIQMHRTIDGITVNLS